MLQKELNKEQERTYVVRRGDRRVLRYLDTLVGITLLTLLLGRSFRASRRVLGNRRVHGLLSWTHRFHRR